MTCLCPIASETVSSHPVAADWQSAFGELLPAIRSQARFALRHLPCDVKEEALQEVTCTACVFFARLHQQGRAEVATASTLARFAVKRYRIGRRVAVRTNVDDVMSAACRQRKNVRVESLSPESSATNGWQDLLVEDSRATPAEIVATRLDFRAFLTTLDRRRRQIAEVLATGESTLHAARMFRLSPGRISQLRQEFKAGWDQFVGNVLPGSAAA